MPSLSASRPSVALSIVVQPKISPSISSPARVRPRGPFPPPYSRIGPAAFASTRTRAPEAN
jgi:hypothetical protein